MSPFLIKVGMLLIAFWMAAQGAWAGTLFLAYVVLCWDLRRSKS